MNQCAVQKDKFIIAMLSVTDASGGLGFAFPLILTGACRPDARSPCEGHLVKKQQLV